MNNVKIYSLCMQTPSQHPTIAVVYRVMYDYGVLYQLNIISKSIILLYLDKLK